MHEPEKFTEANLTELLQVLRAPEDIVPRAGFYARVLDRIEARRDNSIWSVFLEPVFSKRLVFASMAFLVLMGVFLATSAPEPEEFAFDQARTVFVNEDQAAPVLGGVNPNPLHAAPVSLMGAEEGRNVVLVDLISYQER